MLTLPALALRAIPPPPAAAAATVNVLDAPAASVLEPLPRVTSPVVAVSEMLPACILMVPFCAMALPSMANAAPRPAAGRAVGAFAAEAAMVTLPAVVKDCFAPAAPTSAVDES